VIRESRMLTYDQVALELGVGKSKARELVRTGRLTARRMGHRTVRITRESVEQFLRLRSDFRLRKRTA